MNKLVLHTSVCVLSALVCIPTLAMDGIPSALERVNEQRFARLEQQVAALKADRKAVKQSVELETLRDSVRQLQVTALALVENGRAELENGQNMLADELHRQKYSDEDCYTWRIRVLEAQVKQLLNWVEKEIVPQD